MRGNLVHGQTLAPQQDLNYLRFKVDNVAAKNAQIDLGFSSNTVLNRAGLTLALLSVPIMSISGEPWMANKEREHCTDHKHSAIFNYFATYCRENETA